MESILVRFPGAAGRNIGGLTSAPRLPRGGTNRGASGKQRARLFRCVLVAGQNGNLLDLDKSGEQHGHNPQSLHQFPR